MKTRKLNVVKTERYLDRDRLEQISQLISPIMEVLGCGESTLSYSFEGIIDIIIERRRINMMLQPLASAAKPKKWNCFMFKEPYGLMPWFHEATRLGVVQIGRRFSVKSPVVIVGGRLCHLIERK